MLCRTAPRLCFVSPRRLSSTLSVLRQRAVAQFSCLSRINSSPRFAILPSLLPRLSMTGTAASGAAPQSSFHSFADHQMLEVAKQTTANWISQAVARAFPELAPTIDMQQLQSDVAFKLAKVQIKGRAELTLPCFVFVRFLPKGPDFAPPAIAQKLNAALQQMLLDEEKESNAHNRTHTVMRCEASNAYLNFWMTPEFLCSILPRIIDGSYLQRLPYPPSIAGKPNLEQKPHRVMVEYSQRQFSIAAVAALFLLYR